MARALKPQKVQDWTHERRGITLVFFLDRNDNTFFFEYQKQRISKPSIVELQHAALALVEASAALVWLPMITVSRLKPFAREDCGDFIGFEINRSWIAKKVNTDWLQSRWDGFDRDGQDEREKWAGNFYPSRHIADFALPYYGAADHVHDRDQFYLPYTEELWVGLEQLLEKIRLVKTQLDLLLTTPAGLERVASFAHELSPGTFGMKLLPATVDAERPSDRS